MIELKDADLLVRDFYRFFSLSPDDSELDFTANIDYQFYACNMSSTPMATEFDVRNYWQYDIDYVLNNYTMAPVILYLEKDYTFNLDGDKYPFKKGYYAGYLYNLRTKVWYHSTTNYIWDYLFQDNGEPSPHYIGPSVKVPDVSSVVA